MSSDCSKISGNFIGASVLKPFRCVAVFTAALLVFCAVLNGGNVQGMPANAIDAQGKLAYSKQVASLRDSIDLSQSAKALMRVSGKLYRLAVAHGDIPLQIEAMHCYGNSGNVDSISYYISKAEKLPESNAKKDLISLLKVDRAFLNLGQVPESEKLANMEKIVVRYSKHFGKNEDIYDKVEHLFAICISVYYSTNGSLYSNYMKQLDSVISILPPDGRRYLPFLYYIFAGIYYTRAGMPKEAVIADNKNLKLLDELKGKMIKQGRKYATYDFIYFDCYSRMLSNAKVLSRTQVENIYSKMKALAAASSHIREEFDTPYSIDKIRYYMAVKKYAEALPMLNAYFNAGKAAIYQEECMDYFLTASKETGSYKDVLPIALKYIELLKQKSGKDAATKYTELQILYDVNSLQQKVKDLDNQKKLVDAKFEKRRGEIFGVIAFLLLLFSIYAFISLRKGRKLTKQLVKAKEEAESANKMKTMFLQNMSHEIRTPLNAVVGFSQLIAENGNDITQQESLEYKNMIEKNGQLLLTLVGDVLDIARMESGELQFNISETSANFLCSSAYENVKSSAKPDVKMIFVPHNTDCVFYTDQQRVEQVLINYLTNACKFTEKGSVSIDYTVTNECPAGCDDRTFAGPAVVFCVADTGIGIPKEKIQAVFNRFEKLNQFAQGTGLGLHICKLIAKGLHGIIWVESEYHKGSKFMFAVPLEQAKNSKADN
jgi:signal transduction histidine kinase